MHARTQDAVHEALLSTRWLHAQFLQTLWRFRRACDRSEPAIRALLTHTRDCLAELDRRGALMPLHALAAGKVVGSTLGGTQEYAPVSSLEISFVLRGYLDRHPWVARRWVRHAVAAEAVGLHPFAEIATRQFALRVAAGDGKAAFLALTMDLLSDSNSRAYEHNLPHIIAGLFLRHGAYPEFLPADLQPLTDALLAKLDRLQLWHIVSVLNLLGFMIANTTPALAVIYYAVAVPVMNALYAAGRSTEAEEIAWDAFQIYGLKCDSEENFSDFACATAVAGEAAGLARRVASPRARRTGGKQRLGFVMRGGGFVQDGFQHVHALCEYFRQAPESGYEPHLFLTHAYQPSVTEAFAAIGCPVHTHTARAADAPADPFEWLRRETEAQGIDVAVWTGAPGNLAYAFGLGIAPRQIVFSQHFRPAYPLRTASGFVTFGSPALRGATFGGKHWNILPQCVGAFGHADVAAAHTDDVVARLTALRARGRKILTVFARSEKFANPAFLGCVAAVLKQVENAEFAWTGAWHDTHVQSFFDREGLAARTHFIGWVDTVRVARVSDAVLDTFPAATGLTALAALSLGTPVLSRLLPASIFGRDLPAFYAEGSDTPPEAVSIARELRARWPSLDDLPLACASTDQYVSRAVALLSNAAAHQRAVEAGQFLWQRIYANTAMMGTRMEAAIAETLPWG